MREILCSISTRGRNDTTLPLAIMAVVNQTRKVDKLIIFDDNEVQIDVRLIHHYKAIVEIINTKGIEFEWVYAGKKGQHYNHQIANTMGYTWVWRVDDDCIPEPNVLENLMKYAIDGVGGVAGAVLTPPDPKLRNPSSKIKDIYTEQNSQRNIITHVQEAEHLHCSFLYRAGIHDYNLGLSRVAHREETLFTYGLFLKGYKLLLVPDANTWHLKSPHGGIRNTSEDLFIHDEKIFKNIVGLADKTIIVLDCGLGDHIVFKHILPEIKEPICFTCYPEVVPGGSIEQAKELFGSIDQYNIYKKMEQWNWTDTLENAFRKMYL